MKKYLPYLALFLLALMVKIIFFQTHQTFDQDQVNNYLLIKNHLVTANYYLPLGPAPAASDSHFAPPPLYYYLQLLAQFIGNNYFYSMTILIIMIESFTPGLLYFYLQQLRQIQPTKFKSHRFLPFLISLIYLFSPIVIIASTRSWNPHLVPFFTLLFLVASHQFIFHQQGRALVMSLLAFLFLANLHFQWFILLPLLILVLILALLNIKTNKKYLLITFVISLILLSPYLYYEITHQGRNFINALTFITGDNPTISHERIRKPAYLLYFFPSFYARVFTHELYLPDWHYLYAQLPLTNSMIISSLLFWFLILIYLLRLKSLWRLENKSSFWHHFFPLGLFIVMMVFLRLYKGDKPDYFLSIFLPFIFIFLNLALTIIKNKTIILILSGLILSQEIYAWWHIPPSRSFDDWHQIATIIKKVPKSERTIIPLNQNLVAPLLFFFETHELEKSINPHKQVNFLLCEPYQHCTLYQPNLSSPYNFYKYDLVNPIDYSQYLPDYNAQSSRQFKNNSLQVKIIRQNQ